MAKTKQSAAPLITAQQLGSLIKSARDIVRKDKGLNGDLDRLPMLTWIMFLKFLDDLEQIRETDAKLAGKRFRHTIEPPYRWRDWAAKPDGITGDELIAFVNNEEARGPDGKKGPGLFAYLRSLQGANGGDRRDVIATVFKGTVNRMINGYLLRDVVNKVHGIHFTSSGEIHTLGHLYESMLKEMRHAAGDSGEFYTPRAVVRFMVAVTDPRLGETLLDPACGTGGFLVESFEHLRKQCKRAEHYAVLQSESLLGGEAKPLPYLLAQMNLLLHGLETPKIDPLNSLRIALKEIGDRDRVDIILTNPPFGGEEERGILSNFPEDKQTSETALLFLQLIMRKLRRPPKPGRAGVVVPNGTLFGDGVCARIKEELLKDFNLHTIVRLPNGVFAPYTSIPTNLLFFDRSGPTKDVWYYDQSLPEGRKNYTKTQPIQFEEFADCIAWWHKRKENDRAWKVPAADIQKNGCNLDIKNPRGKVDFEHLPPEQLVDDILKKEQRIAEIMGEIKTVLTRDVL
jgi:type I restriction enzyme M protein